MTCPKLTKSRSSQPKNNDLILQAIIVSASINGGDPEDFEIWISRYAELLGCDERAGAVAVAIESLVEQLREAEQFKRKYFAMVAKERARTKKP